MTAEKIRAVAIWLAVSILALMIVLFPDRREISFALLVIVVIAYLIDRSLRHKLLKKRK